MATKTDMQAPFTKKRQKTALSYRSVPSWLVGSAFASSLVFAGLCVFQLLPMVLPDARIAPPEFSPLSTSHNTAGDFSSRSNEFLQNLTDWIRSRTSVATDQQINATMAEYNRRLWAENWRKNGEAPPLGPILPGATNANASRNHLAVPALLTLEAQIESLNRQHLTPIFFFAGLSVLSAFLALRLRDRRLIVNADGLQFPTGMLPELDWRRRRKWRDLSAIGLSGQGTESAPRTIQIYFGSGGKAQLLTGRLTPKDLEQFFLALDEHAPQVTRSPDLVAFRHELFNSSRDPSYTQLWEDELNSHFASTNFVALSPNATLQNGKIKIAMHLSSGGLSAVYLAERNKGMAVVKESVVPPGTSAANRDKAREMFLREAKMLMQLSHPKIAKVIDHFQENERDYLLLEYIPGITLREYIRRHGPQDEARVVEWSRQVAGILKYLHEQNPPVIHRDLTPDNLMLTPDGDIVLIDFGAANLFLGSATGTIIGKQFYISPEQFRGKAVPASDIYSLGGTMFYLLTGQDPEALSVAHPKLAIERISPEMDSLVARCTELNESNRFASAAKLLETLREFANASSVAAMSPDGLSEEAVILSTKQREKQRR